MKEAVIRGTDVCTVTIKKWIVAARDLKNTFTQKFTEMQEGGAPMEEILEYMGAHTMYRALVQGDTEEGELPCGQDAGIISGLKSAGEIVNEMMAEIPAVLKRLSRLT